MSSLLIFIVQLLVLDLPVKSPSSSSLLLIPVKNSFSSSMSVLPVSIPSCCISISCYLNLGKLSPLSFSLLLVGFSKQRLSSSLSSSMSLMFSNLLFFFLISSISSKLNLSVLALTLSQNSSFSFLYDISSSFSMVLDVSLGSISSFEMSKVKSSFCNFLPFLMFSLPLSMIHAFSVSICDYSHFRWNMNYTASWTKPLAYCGNMKLQNYFNFYNEFQNGFISLQSTTNNYLGQRRERKLKILSNWSFLVFSSLFIFFFFIYYSYGVYTLVCLYIRYCAFIINNKIYFTDLQDTVMKYHNFFEWKETPSNNSYLLNLLKRAIIFKRKIQNPVLDHHHYLYYKKVFVAKNKTQQYIGISYQPLLYFLLCQILPKSGLIQLLSTGDYRSVFQHLTKNISQFVPKTLQVSSTLLLALYKRMLLQYEYSLEGKPLICRPDVRLDICLQEAYFYDDLKEILALNNYTMEYFAKDICLFKNGEIAIGLCLEKFNLNVVCERYGEDVTDIRIQKPMDQGFNPYKLLNTPYEMKIKEYRQYQLDANNISAQHKALLHPDKIFFSVNFDPKDDWMQSFIREAVGNTFLSFCGKDDLLSYLDENIPGCTVPQFYLKVKGCWTGGHQQNISMCAVNINHGPHFSQWYSISSQYISILRTALKVTHNQDLYQNEGLWFQKLQWFLQQGFPIKRLLQKKGDIVLSGPGTLHWVRSFGTALHSAWNIMPKTSTQMRIAFARYRENQLIHFPKIATILFKSLLIKYLNHQMKNIDRETRVSISCGLDRWVAGEETVMRTMFRGRYRNKVKLEISHLSDVQSICKDCAQEIILYYVRMREGGILCVKCFERTTEENSRFYTKYQVYLLKKMIQIGKLKQIQEYQEIQELCWGKHIGKIGVQCKKQNKQNIEKKQILEIMENIVRKIEECQISTNIFLDKNKRMGNHLQQINVGRKKYIYASQNNIPIIKRVQQINEQSKQIVTQLQVNLKEQSLNQASKDKH